MFSQHRRTRRGGETWENESGRGKKEKRTMLMRRRVKNTEETRLMGSERRHEQTTGHASHRDR